MKETQIVKKEVKQWGAAILFSAMLAMPMLAYAAPGWATETKTHLDTFATGLKYIGGAIATIVLIWCAYEILWGGKRLQDMKNWIIGALIFASSGHIVSLFFTTTTP